MFKKYRLVKKKILLYYFLAIVLPSIILGVLAFRGIMNDQAINEKESRRSLTETGNHIIAESDLFLAKTEEQFALKTNLPETSFLSGNFFHDSILTEFHSKNPVIQSILHINNSGDIQLLNSGLLFFPDGACSKQSTTLETNTNSILLKGWEYEFQEKNYPKALRYYQNLLEKTNDKYSAQYLMFPVARIQKKLLKYEDALHTFRLIKDEYSKERMEGGLPLGAVALVETGKLYLTIYDTLNALKSTVELLSLTLENYWELEFSHYNQLITACGELIKACETCNDKLCQRQKNQAILLFTELKIQAENTSRQLMILEKSATVLEESGGRSPMAKSEYRVYMNLEREATFFSVFPENSGGRWIIVYNLNEILNQLTQVLIPAEQEMGIFEWQVFKEGRELIEQSPVVLTDGIKTTSVFPSYLPAWSIVLFKEPANLITTFLSASQGIFLYIFLFIVIGLALGLIFTLQIINKELVLSKMKSDFISTVSHEFKSPLTSIRQMTEMLHNERIKTEPRKKEYYAIMLEQTERLSHLIDNILDFSKIEEGKKAFRFDKTDILELINHVKDVYQKSIEDGGFIISLSVPEKLPVLIIDKDAIQQVLYNLLDNAYKYSGDSKEIKIVADVTGNSVKISIEDFGVGIDRDDRHKIFERFYRGGRELTRSIKGSGIGLTIVKKIIEAHNGTISFESTPGEGSTFIVYLPLKQED